MLHIYSKSLLLHLKNEKFSKKKVSCTIFFRKCSSSKNVLINKKKYCTIKDQNNIKGFIYLFIFKLHFF